jgi:glutaminase
LLQLGNGRRRDRDESFCFNKVGIPAKSGVSGGIIVTVPNQMGIGVFSPLLDERSNSIWGVKVCEELSQQFGLHLFDCAMGGKLIQTLKTQL